MSTSKQGLVNPVSDLKWDGYSARMLSSLYQLKEHDILCDLTLVAENEPVRVHRVVVAACSDYFQALLTLDMKEKGQKVITLKGRGFKHIRVDNNDARIRDHRLNFGLIYTFFIQFMIIKTQIVFAASFFIFASFQFTKRRAYCYILTPKAI